jgi:hypothetical protein
MLVQIRPRASVRNNARALQQRSLWGISTLVSHAPHEG